MGGLYPLNLKFWLKAALNNRYIYIPFGIVFLLTIFLLANEIDFINLMPQRTSFIVISIILAVILAIIASAKVHPLLKELSIYQVFPMFLILACLFSVTYLSLANRSLDFSDCQDRRVEITSYLGRYASGYGAVNHKLEASHYVLHFVDEGEVRRIVSSSPVFSSNSITNQASLRFCKGALGFEYVKILL